MEWNGELRYISKYVHFLNKVHKWRKGSLFFFFLIDIQLLQNYLLKNEPWPTLYTSQKIQNRFLT